MQASARAEVDLIALVRFSKILWNFLTGGEFYVCVCSGQVPERPEQQRER